MARKTIVLDDMEAAKGDEVLADAGTVHFGLDGKSYEIDLGAANAAKLRGVLRPFIENGRPVGRGYKAPSTSTPKVDGYSTEQYTAMREWARAQGMEVSAKGRVAKAIIEAFEQAHARSPLVPA